MTIPAVGGYMSGQALRLTWIPLLTGLVPTVVVLVCYAVSAGGGHIPTCIPWLQGCTTISSTGRHGISYFLFKGGMIPAAVLLGLFWPLCRRWFLSLGGTDSRGLRAMAWLGVISAAFLVLYVLFLGSQGDFYSLMRRYGVTVHFAFSYLAQMLLLNRLWDQRRSGELPLPNYITNVQLVIGIGLFVLGLVNIPIEEIIPDPEHRMERIIEWNFALLLFGWYFFAWRAWVLTGFAADLRTDRATG